MRVDCAMILVRVLRYLYGSLAGILAHLVDVLVKI